MTEEPFLRFAMFAMGLVLGGLFGVMLASDVWRRDAVKQGKAEFGVTESGSVMWRWKP